MSHPEFERPFPVSKDILDTVNSVTWFAADGFWMLGSHELALAFLVPTVVTGLGLLYIEKRASVILINLAINCWTWMNGFWVIYDMTSGPGFRQVSQVFFVLGVLSIIIAAIVSRSVRETFSHFRRFRGMKWPS